MVLKVKVYLRGTAVRHVSMFTRQYRGWILTICHNQARQNGLVNGLDGITTENSVRDNSKDFASTVIMDGGCGLGELRFELALWAMAKSHQVESYSSTSISHIIHKDGDLVLDVANKHHTPDNVGPRPLLVNESKSGVEAIGNRRRALRTASVGGDDNAVLNVEVLTDPTKHRRLGIQVVDRDVEKALDLRGVEIHGDDVILEL